MTDHNEPWCRSCGAVGIGEATVCPICQARTEPPVRGSDRVGRIVSVKSGLLHRPAICVADGSENVSIVSKGAEVQPLATAVFDQMESVPLPGESAHSAPGRLLYAAISSENGTFKAKWDSSYLKTIATEAATVGIASARGAAADWLGFGALTETQTLPLTRSEVAWVQAVLAARKDDAAEALASIELLPVDRYPAKLGVLLHLSGSLVLDPDLQVRSVAIAQPFLEDSADARCIVGAFSTTPMHDRLSIALELLNLHNEHSTEPETWSQLERLVSAIDAGTPVCPDDPDSYPNSMALAIFHNGLNGTNVDADAARLEPITQTMYDDLIESDALTATGVLDCMVSEAERQYLQARTDPASLSDESLLALGAEAELARRLFARGDVSGLNKLSPGSPDVSHYDALLRICNDGGGSDDRLRPDAAELLAEVNEYRQQIAESGAAVVPDSLVNDPTSWRFLRDEARSGRVLLKAEQRARSPRFASWLDLYELEACVFANEWTKVRDLGEQLLARSEQEELRDEILNLSAYAQFQLGNDRAALKMLSEALEGLHSESLIVNASVVASRLGSQEAATFLARMYDETPNPEIGTMALLKGVDLWLGDATSVALPDALRSSIRTALSRPLDDDAMLRLLRLASGQDQDWLAATPAISAMSENQSDMINFFGVMARFASPEHQTGLDKVAEALIATRRREPVAPWAEREFTLLIASLHNLIHVDFGQASYLAEPITLLMDAGVLGFEDFVILGTQVGAHLSVAIEEGSRNSLSAQAEEKYLVVPLTRFLSEREIQPDDVVERVLRDVAQCQARAAYAMFNAVSHIVDEFSKEWGRLVQQERVDYQNRAAIIRREVVILNGLAADVERLGRFQQRIRVLTFNEVSRELYLSIDSGLNSWRSEVNRLRALL